MIDMKLFGYWIIALLLLSIETRSQTAGQKIIQKINQLDSLCEKTYYEPDKMVAYAKQAQDLSLKAHYKKGEAISLKFIAIYHHSKSNFAEALPRYLKALKMFRELKIEEEIAKTELSIAILYSNTNDFVNSIRYGLSCLKKFESLKDLKGQGKVFNLMGIVSARQNELEKAKGYFFRYNELAKKGSDTVTVAYSYNNLGGIYRDLKNPDSALHFFKIASALFKKSGYLPGVSLADKNIGSIYFDKNDFKNALLYAQKGLDVNLRIGDKRAQCHSYHDIGSCYRKLRNYPQATLSYQKALSLAGDIDEKEILKNSNAEMAEMNEELLDYKNALKHFKLFKQAEDSIFNSDKLGIIKELETKYETEKKSQQIKALNQQAEIHNLQIKHRNISLIIAFVLLIFIISTAYFLNNKRKQKAQVELQKEINKQQDLRARAVLKAEEVERRRIAGDLHDGVGQLLSASLMNFKGLVQKLDLNDELSLQAERTLALINESYDEMRSISHQMMPNALIKTGLASAIKEFLDKIDQEKIRVTLEVSGLNERLDEQTETVLYRVVQETVSNVIKHSQADRLDIQLAKEPEGISLTIEDNGKGFDPTKISFKSGLGLNNIQSRIELLKGSVDIDSSVGRGTLIAIFIPNLPS